MKEQKIKQAFDSVALTQQEKDALLQNILSASGHRPAERKRTMKYKKTLLIAAIITAMAIFMGCAVAALSTKQLKLDEYETTTPAWIDADGERHEATEVTKTVLSLQGLENTPEQKAAKEWYEFCKGYDTDHSIYMAAQGKFQAPEEYDAYDVYSQEMVDKLDEICAKYGLKVIGKAWHEQVDCNKFLPLLGIDSLLKAGTDATLSIPAGRYFPGGSFTIYGTLNLGDAAEMFTYQCVKKDVFYDVFGYTNPDSVTERNYTTSDGVPLLFLESEQSGMILADREDCFLSLSIMLDGNVSLEEIAECFDFTIQPQAPDATAADAREQASNAEIISTQDDPNIGRRATYAEYVEDLIRGDEFHTSTDPEYTPPVKTYAFYDADGNGTDELLIFYGDRIGSIVGMKDGVTDEGKSYTLIPCEDHVFIDWPRGPYVDGEYWYHIFRFANNDDPVFSNPKERSIVRLKKDAEGNWWRTSSTDHYADFDTRITEEEAKAILDSYTPIQLETHPLSEFKEP